MPTDRSRMSARRRIARHTKRAVAVRPRKLSRLLRLFLRRAFFCILDRCESHRRATEACDDDVPLLCRALRLRGVAVGCLLPATPAANLWSAGREGTRTPQYCMYSLALRVSFLRFANPDADREVGHCCLGTVGACARARTQRGCARNTCRYWLVPFRISL